jgi:hypothetical protein
VAGSVKRVPDWVRILIGAVGLVLIGIAVWSNTSVRGNGAGEMLTAGVLLLLAGPLMNHLASLALGPVKLTFDDLVAANQLAASEYQMAEGDVQPANLIRLAEAQVTKGEVREIKPGFIGGGEFTAEAERTKTGVVEPSVGVTVGAFNAIQQLNEDDHQAVTTAIQKMPSLKNGGGVPLPDSDQFWVRKVNDHVRLVYRPLKDNPTNPYDYMILNAPLPGSTLWRMTDAVL